MGNCLSYADRTSPQKEPSPEETRDRNGSNGSSVHKYDEQGRRLHNNFLPISEDSVPSDKLYILPNDDEEMDRLHLQHYIMGMLFQSNFSAPVGRTLKSEDGARVLDLGCGSGIWAFETATEYPLASIQGMDISPVQPTTIKPRNVEFIVGDLTNLPLPFKDNSFDFVHMRFLTAGLRTEFWPVLINDIVRILKPGGYVELMEPRDLAIKGATRIPNLLAFIVKAVETRGCDPDIALRLHSYLTSHPLLTDVHEITAELHTKPNPSIPAEVRIAKLWGEDLKGVMEGVKAGLIAKGISTEEGWDELVRGHIAETLETEHTVYLTRCFARKMEWKKEV
ncbi:hypothetical protein HDV00_007695 [Rhizophlyctis rosea]|nr:hypothetical protein HDV00_007695 [Rhizophlyctis rosea]